MNKGYCEQGRPVGPTHHVDVHASSTGECRTPRGYTRKLMQLAQLLLLVLAFAGCTQTLKGPATTGGVSWVDEDIGPVGLVGTYLDEPARNELKVQGAGSDIWGSEDSFHFVYVPWSGDVEFQARVEEISYTHDWAKAGLMVRSALTSSSAHGFVGLTPTGTVEFLHRDETGGLTQSSLLPQQNTPVWLRIRRSGSSIKTFVSKDGAEWTEVGEAEVDLMSDVYVGVAVTSRDTQRLAEAVVANTRLSSFAGGKPIESAPTPTPNLPERRGPVDGSGWACSQTPLSPSYKPTYFVSTSGSDSNDGRSEATPFRSLQRAARVVEPGDVVWVRGGVYSSNVAFERSGTSDAPIVFESYPGECAIFDGSGQARLQRLQFWNLSFNVFRNFVVRNSPGEGIYLSSVNNSQFTHLRLHHNAMSGILSMYGNENLFSRFVSHDNFDRPNGGDADGISVSSGNGNRVSNCVTYNNSDDGVDTWLSTNSVVDSCVSFSNGFSGGDGNGFKAGGDNRQVDTVVRRSVAFGNRTSGFTWNSGKGVTLEYNTAFNNGLYGFVANSATERNNLAISNGAGPFSGDPGRNTQVTNSWNLGLSGNPFVSSEPSDSRFLSLEGASRARGAGTEFGYGTDLGAIPYGQTLSSYLGINLEAAMGGPQ